jgi:hypothetical protein
MGPLVEFSSRLSMTPKRGEEKSDDAGCENKEKHVYALCDGATQSFLPGVWAEILAEHVCHSFPPAPPQDLRTWLAPARARWEEERRSRSGDAAAPASGANWWLKTPGRQSGATLCAISFRESGEFPEYTAVMRGDTCCFHVRAGELRRAMPFTASVDFTSHPDCLLSIAEPKEAELRVESGVSRPGDVFYLATDALAKWILERCEAKEPPWERLHGLDSEQLRSFANEQRESNRMDEDDVSLLVVELRRPPKERRDEPEGAPRLGERDGAAPRGNDREVGRLSPARQEASRALAGPVQGAARASPAARARGPAPLALAPRAGTQRPAPTEHDESLAGAAALAAAAVEPRVASPRTVAPSTLRGRLIWSVLVPACVSLVVVAAGLSTYVLWLRAELPQAKGSASGAASEPSEASSASPAVAVSTAPLPASVSTAPGSSVPPTKQPAPRAPSKNPRQPKPAHGPSVNASNKEPGPPIPAQPDQYRSPTHPPPPQP